MKKTITRIGSLLCIVLLCIHCDDRGITEDTYLIGYQRTQQLENVYVNEILPLSTAFVLKTGQLATAIATFKTTTTVDHLTIVRTRWIEALKVWKRLELYNLGTVEDRFIHYEINRWATNTVLINNYITGTDGIDESFIRSKGSSSKGISAMEYLLFSDEDTDKVMASFTQQANHTRRIKYLLALSNDLHTKATELKNIWVQDKEQFINAIENGTSGSQNQLTNALISLLEEIIIKKLGNPLGNNSGGTVAISELEAYRSETSLAILQEHLIALKRCYFGDFKEDSIKWGYDNYLLLIGNEHLTIRVLDVFNELDALLTSFEGSLKNELVSNPTNIVKLRKKFTDLLVLIKVDLANTIGATVTISDNDGD